MGIKKKILFVGALPILTKLDSISDDFEAVIVDDIKNADDLRSGCITTQIKPLPIFPNEIIIADTSEKPFWQTIKRKRKW